MAEPDDLVPTPDETLDDLSLERRVLQRRKGHRSGTDDVLAAYSAWLAGPSARTLLDLGCGHGSVSLYLTSVLPRLRGVAVEAQAVSASLARRNMRLNGVDKRITVLERDLRTLDDAVLTEAFGACRFDLITGTPPFMPVGSGPIAKDPQRAAARFELRGGIEAYCAAAARFLAPEGSVSMLMDASQDERCRRAFADAGIALQRRIVVTPRVGKAPRYIGYIGGAAGVFDHDLPVTIRTASGEFAHGYRAIRRALKIDRK